MNARQTAVAAVTALFILTIGTVGYASGVKSSTDGDDSTASRAADRTSDQTRVTAENSQQQQENRETDPEAVERGDMAAVHYTMRLENGEVIFTTDRAVAENPAVEKAAWFRRPARYAPEEIRGGNDEALRYIADAIVGMKPGGKKTITLSPDKAFGPSDDKKIQEFTRVRQTPRVIEIQATAYVNRYGTFPSVGDEVNYTPFFKSRVVDFDSRKVVLEALAEDGVVAESPFGKTRIELTEDEVHLTLEPIVGSDFVAGGRQGRIVEVGEETFSVDFNHPGAGKSLLLDIEVVSVQKADQFAQNELEWIEDLIVGHELAAEEQKPVVLVLYADWCSWCKKLMENTIPDPRIQRMWDRFVWVKVNSDKNVSYKEMYNQDGFPLVVMIDAQGAEVRRVEGFRDARAFRHELEKCLQAVGESGQG